MDTLVVRLEQQIWEYSINWVHTTQTKAIWHIVYREWGIKLTEDQIKKLYFQDEVISVGNLILYLDYSNYN